MPRGWHRHSREHALAAHGISIKQQVQNIKGEMKEIQEELDVEAPEDWPYADVEEAIERFNEIVPQEETQRAYCVEFARALRDTLGYGINYHRFGHNYIKLGDYFIDSSGMKHWALFRPKELPQKDPDGWLYIYNEDKLNEYRKILGELL